MIGFFFQDPSGGIAWGIGAITIFIIAAVAALLAFKLMKKTVKMAFRMTIVLVILLAAVIGSFALWWFGSGTSSTNQRPGSSQTR
jgi:apolipoprotein N-acyltransferase